MKQTKDPVTAQEWQEAVDAAHVMLAIDSARQYGLIETDIQVDVERCDEILQEGKKLGYTPATDAIEKTFEIPARDGRTTEERRS